MTIIDFDVLKSFADSFGYDIVIEKRVNGRNIAKLIKRRVQDKNGKMTTVYVKNGEEMKIHTNRNGKTVGEIDVTGKTKHLPGSKVNFSNQYGKNQSGIVIESRNNMDVIQDIHGVNHSVSHSAIQVKHLTPEADNKRIAAKDFNAAEFNRKYDDFEANGSYKGVDYALHKFINELKDSHPEIEQQINYDIKRAEEKPETISLYRIKGEGAESVYSKEREAVHAKIINEILSETNRKRAMPQKGEKPLFILLGGRGGSGKSTFNKDKHPDSGVYSKSKVITVDPDDLKERLANLTEKEGWKGYMARAYHEESSDLSKKIMKIAVSMGLNVVMDITMSNADKQIEELQLASAHGYRTGAYYMHVPKQESFRRAMHRYILNPETKQVDYSGRLVPPSVLLNMVDNEKNFDKIRKYADDWCFYNNFIPWKNPDGTVNDAVKVSEGGNQKKGLLKISDVIDTIISGSDADKENLKMHFFELAKTSDLLKKYGMTGDNITVRYGVITKHLGKNNNHDLTAENWKEISKKINTPFLITKGKDGNFRVFVDTKVNGNYVMVALEVKNIARNVEVNSVKTVFSKEQENNSEILYIAPNIKDEQLALLNESNLRQYLAAHQIFRNKSETERAHVNQF